MKFDESPRRILLVRNDRLGDLVLTLPAFEAARRLFPNAHLAALVNPYLAPLLAGTSTLDEVVLDDPQERPRKLAARLAAMRFDTAVVFNTNTRNCLAVWWAGIPCRVTWAGKAAGLLTGNRRVTLRRSHPPVHEADFALAFVRRLGASEQLPAALPRFTVDDGARRQMRDRIHRDLGCQGPIFGVHPGNNYSAYNWPRSHYVELIARLSQHGRVVVTGGPTEHELLAALHAALPRASLERVRFYNDLSLMELAATLEMQTAVTVSSTGPMHLAALAGTPVVALFSPHPAHVPAKWAPLGVRHTIMVAPLANGEDPRIPREHGTALMARISVEQVLSANLGYAAVPGVRGVPAPMASLTAIT